MNTIPAGAGLLASPCRPGKVGASAHSDPITAVGFNFAPLLAVILSVACCAVLRADPGTLVHDSVIDPLAHNFSAVSYSVATVHGVTFQQDGVTTYKGWQYATYYQGNLANSTGKVAVARRPLPDGAWQTLVLNDYTFTTVDSHNDVVLGICAGDGSIHLSFDHHAVNLKYRASIPGAADNPATTAWTPALFGPTTDHLTGSTAMTAVTYPRFIPTPSGKLLFTYRFGGSGGGDEILYEFDGASHAWSLVGKYVTRSGSYTGAYPGTDRNAYFDNTLFDANGRLHATWCWRETGATASSNHDLLYAYSDDVGRTWKNQLGANIAVAGSSFIAVNSPGIAGWSIPQNRNYINNSAMTVDRQGRVHVVAWHLPASSPDQTAFSASLSSNSRFIHYWRGGDGIWRKNETDLTGSRAKLAADDDGRLFLIYGNATNLQIAAANPASNPEADPSHSWNDWAPLTLSGALPAGKANTVNIITDTTRWNADRILSVYAQETNLTGTAPTPLHILDFHVSRAAVLPVPSNESTDPGIVTAVSWTAGQGGVQHDFYLGTSAAVVAAATTASPEYLGRQAATTRTTGTMLPLTRYFWRVDSVDALGKITPGRVWSFTNGDGTPAVSHGPASRAYGGRATFQATLELRDPVLATGDLMLHLGATDGGTDPGAWQKSIALGPQTAGSHSFTLDGIPAGALQFRFQVTTPHGSSFSPSAGTLAADGDLASWGHAAEIGITGYGGAETLGDFPLLIRLSPSLVPGFAYGDMLSPPHGDLRFSTLSGTVLAHEVEAWNAAGTSSVWVKLPQLAPGEKLLVWWGKAGQSPPPTAPTWSAFHGVWHLDEGLGFAQDSSPKDHSATATGITAAETGVIPGAAGLNGTTATVAIDNSVALNPSFISVEAWVKTSNSTGIPSVFNKDNSGTGRVWQFRINAGKPEFIAFNATTNATAASPDGVSDNQFHHLCGTWDGATIRIFVDGAMKGSTPFAGTLRANQPNQAFIGRGENVAPNYFTGSIDEVRLSPVARSADWIRASFDNQKPAATFVTAAAVAAPDLDGDHQPDEWEMEHFGSTFTSDQDPDADGQENFAEFALGTDPMSGADQPAIAFLPNSGGSTAEFVYPQIAGGSGEIGTTYTAAKVRYSVEVSADLAIWHAGPGVVVWSGRRETLPGGMERVGIRVTEPVLATAPQIFARLRLTGVE